MTQSSPTVSVIVPSYNRGAMVGEAIRSVLAQTLEELELIVVDDASTDNTEEVVRAFHDPRLRYIRHESNRGSQAARNTGIQNAKGEFVFLLDSDDALFPEALEKQVEVFRVNPHNLENLGAVGLGTAWIDSRTGGLVKQVIPRVRGNIRSQFFVERGGVPLITLVRRECFSEVGLCDEGLPAIQRWDIGVRLAGKYQFDFVAQPLYKALRHDGHHVGQGNMANIARAYAILFDKYRDEFESHPKFYSTLRRALSRIYLDRGERANARREAWLSIRLNPRQWKGYAYIVLSLFGQLPLKTLSKYKRKLRRPGTAAQSSLRGTR